MSALIYCFYNVFPYYMSVLSFGPKLPPLLNGKLLCTQVLKYLVPFFGLLFEFYQHINILFLPTSFKPCYTNLFYIRS